MKNSGPDSDHRSRQGQPQVLASPKGLGASQKAILESQANICKTMGHPIRLFLLHYLHERGEEVGSSELANLAGISRAAFSQHLSKMTAVGLVKARRAGKYVYVSLAQQDIGHGCELMSRALSVDLAERKPLMEPDPPQEEA